MAMKIATAAAVALAVVCPASAETRISVSERAGAIDVRRARGGSVVDASIDTDVERSIATVRFDLTATTRGNTTVIVPIHIRGGARVIGMAVTVGGELLVNRTLSPDVARETFMQLTSPAIATDPALLAHRRTRHGVDELQLSVFPLNKDRGAHVELTVALPTDGWAISEPEEPYVSRGISFLAVEPPRTRVPTLIICGFGIAHHNGDLDKTIIRRYVQRHLPRVRGCYESALLGNPTLAGTVELHFSIAADGRTSDISVDGSLESPAVRSCIAEDLASWEFPVVPEGTTMTRVNYPITLVSPN